MSPDNPFGIRLPVCPDLLSSGDTDEIKSYLIYEKCNLS